MHIGLTQCRLIQNIFLEMVVKIMIIKGGAELRAPSCEGLNIL